MDLGRPARLTEQLELQQLLNDIESLRDTAFVITPDYARLARDLPQMDHVTGRIRAAEAEVATPSSVEATAEYEQEAENTDGGGAR